jgi:hypothetical protein
MSIESAPDELIETYTEDRGRGPFSDEIVSSAVNDGDFARYRIDNRVNRWSPAAIGTIVLPTPGDIFRSWTDEFYSRATSGQREAFFGKIGNVHAGSSLKNFSKEDEYLPENQRGYGLGKQARLVHPKRGVAV